MTRADAGPSGVEATRPVHRPDIKRDTRRQKKKTDLCTEVPCEPGPRAAGHVDDRGPRVQRLVAVRVVARVAQPQHEATDPHQTLVLVLVEVRVAVGEPAAGIAQSLREA